MQIKGQNLLDFNDFLFIYIYILKYLFTVYPDKSKTWSLNERNLNNQVYTVYINYILHFIINEYNLYIVHKGNTNRKFEKGLKDYGLQYNLYCNLPL